MSNPSIPFYERFILRRIVSPIMNGMALEGAQKLFLDEGQKILSLASSLSEAEQITRRNIPRVFGIEKISMDWSPAMVMEHLWIVGFGAAPLIDQLSQGKAVDVDISPAKVKPKGGFSATEARDQFQDMLNKWPNRFDLEKLKQAPPVTLYHPWFGHLTASGWYKFLAIHQQVHRKQMEGLVGAK